MNGEDLLNRVKSSRVVVPPNRQFEARLRQEARSNIFQSYLVYAFRQPARSWRIIESKVQTAWIQTETVSGSVVWNEVVFSPRPKLTFEAFGLTWKVYREVLRYPGTIETWVFTAEPDETLELSKPGSANVPDLPETLTRVILNS